MGTSVSSSDCPITWEVEEFLFFILYPLLMVQSLGKWRSSCSDSGIILCTVWMKLFQQTFGSWMEEDCFNRYLCFSRHICFSVCLFFAGCIIVIFCTLLEKRISILVRAVSSFSTSAGDILKLLCGKQCLFSFAGNRASNVIAGNALL